MYLIGLDIGGTKCAACVAECGASPKIEEKYAFPTAGKNYNEVFKIFSEKIAGYIKKYPVEAIGIACGGPLDSKRGVILSPPNLVGWDNVEIVKYFNDKFGLPVFLENDANACALAEWKYGAGRGADNLVYMTYGTGLGAGLILNGKLYSGANGNAGEIGHIRLEESGPEGFGKQGSAEGFCSGGGIVRLAEYRYGFTYPSAKYVFEKAREGNAVCRSTVEESALKLGRLLAAVIDFLNPEVIVLGGVFMRNADLFMPHVSKVLLKECLPSSLAACKVLPAATGEAIGDFSALAAAEANL